MSDNILYLIYEFTKNYKDPINKLPFDEKNRNIQVIEKNGKVLYEKYVETVLNDV